MFSIEIPDDYTIDRSSLGALRTYACFTGLPPI